MPPVGAAASPVAASSPSTSGQPPPVPTSVTVTPGQPAVLRCLDNRVTVQADPDGLPAQTVLTCRPGAPTGVPEPPGPVVAEIIFRLDVTPSPGQSLPKPVNLQVTYPSGAVPPPDREQLTIGYLDGTEWKPVPEQTNQPSANRVTAMVDRPGVYALYRQP